jgi:hypothetical protein
MKVNGFLNKLEDKGEYVILEVIVRKSEHNQNEGMKLLHLGTVRIEQIGSD